MKTKIFHLLRCPMHPGSAFTIYPILVKNDKILLKHPSFNELKENDEILEGLLICSKKEHVYPIIEGIPLLLSDQEIQKEFQIECLNHLKMKCPVGKIKIVEYSIKRIINIQKKNEIDSWTNAEINYFDRDVETKKKRDKFKKLIDIQPLWHRYLPRWQFLFEPISNVIKGGNVLEIGCGNTRTVSWMFNPKQFHYNYIGIDLSFKRLLLAREILPEGNFVQGSALNLPFANECFQAVLSLGVLHHLPEPQKGLEICLEKIVEKGFFAMHEPIFNKSRRKIADLIRRIFPKNKDNEHDRDIDFDKINVILKNKFFFQIKIKFEQSILIQSLYSLPGKSIFKRNKRIAALFLKTDSIFMTLLGEKNKLFGPTGVLLLSQKVSK